MKTPAILFAALAIAAAGSLKADLESLGETIRQRQQEIDAQWRQDQIEQRQTEIERELENIKLQREREEWSAKWDRDHMISR